MSLTIHPTDPTSTQTYPLTGYIQLFIKDTSLLPSLQHIHLHFSARSKVDIQHETTTSGSNGSTSTHTSHYRSKNLLFSHHYTLDTKGGDVRFEISESRRGEDGGMLYVPFEVVVPRWVEGVLPEETKALGGDVLAPMTESKEPKGREGLGVRVFDGCLGYDSPGAPRRGADESGREELPESMIGLREDVKRRDVKVVADVVYTLKAEAVGIKVGGLKGLMASGDGWIRGRTDISVIGPDKTVVDVAREAGGRGGGQWQQEASDEKVRSLRLLRSYREGKKLSLRENMRSVFRKEKLPWCTLRVSVRVWDVWWLGAPDEESLPVSINVVRLGSGVGAEGGDSSRSRSRSRSRSHGRVGLDEDDEKDGTMFPEKGGSGNDDEKGVFTSAGSEEIPNPKISLKRLTLYLTAITTGRGAEETKHKYGGQPWTAYSKIPIVDYRAKRDVNLKQQRGEIEVPVGEGQWLDVGQLVGATWADVRKAGEESSKRAEGGVQPGFRTANIERRWGMGWKVALEVAGEEVEWECECEEGDGVELRLYRGTGDGKVRGLEGKY